MAARRRARCGVRGRGGMRVVARRGRGSVRVAGRGATACVGRCGDVATCALWRVCRGAWGGGVRVVTWLHARCGVHVAVRWASGRRCAIPIDIGRFT